MPLILGCIDRDPYQREKLLSSFSARVAARKELTLGTFSSGDLLIAWGAPKLAPIDMQRGDDGRNALVFGDLFEPADSKRSGAQFLLDKTVHNTASSISGQNGYYLGIIQDLDGCLSLGTDALGYFPLYWCEVNGVLIFSSAIGLLKHHPCFSAKPSAAGIAGVLATSYIVGNQTILEGVRRLPPQAFLEWKPGAGTSEKHRQNFVISEAYQGFSRAQCLESMHEAFDQAIATACRGNVSLMFSGGLDSRLAAAYATKHASELSCFTFGMPGDFEFHCARSVTRNLGLKHIRLADDMQSYPRLAHELSELQCMGGTFVDLAWDTGYRYFAETSTPIVTGFLGDVTMCGNRANDSLNEDTQRHEFSRYWSKMRRYGIKDSVLTRMMDSAFFRGATEAAREASHTDWLSLPGSDYQKTWRYFLLNRGRYHVASFASEIALYSWPKMPFCDRRLLDRTLNFPFRFMQDRSLQRELLAQKFPRLAALPLDTNSAFMRPIHATFLNKATAKIYGHPIVTNLIFGGRERRTYYRLFDINNPGWKAVREKAKPALEQLQNLFPKDTLDDLLPPKAKPLYFDDAIIDSAGPKTLLGLALALTSTLKTPSVAQK